MFVDPDLHDATVTPRAMAKLSLDSILSPTNFTKRKYCSIPKTEYTV